MGGYSRCKPVYEGCTLLAPAPGSAMAGSAATGMAAKITNPINNRMISPANTRPTHFSKTDMGTSSLGIGSIRTD